MAKAKKANTENSFEHEGGTYKMLLPAVELPEMGIRTAAEICLDDDDAARAYLVSCGCLGTVIEIINN